MKFFKLIQRDRIVGDVLGYESRDNEKGMLLKPSPVPFMNHNKDYTVAEVIPIGRMIPHGIISGLYYSEHAVITNVFDIDEMLDLYDNLDWIYNYLISIKDNEILKNKAFAKLYQLDDECKYLLKFVKKHREYRLKVLHKILAIDKTGDIIFKFGIMCMEFSNIVEKELMRLNNLELLVEYSKYIDTESAWKIQTFLLMSDNISPGILMEFAIHNHMKGIYLEDLGCKIYELNGDVAKFYNRFGDIIEKQNKPKWWDVG